MSLVLKLLYQSLRRFDTENKDVRTESLFLMGSPLPILAITICYWVFIKKLGPSLMKHRPAYELKLVLLIYNLFQVFLNLVLIYLATSHFIANNMISKWVCMVSYRNTTGDVMTLMRTFHYYYLIKVLDYMDTIFFVLRKRHNQITFLHVYHHIVMAVGCYLGVRYVGGGQCILLGYLNSYVHAIMYFYYFMSALRPAMKNSLWWKKYITQLQIVQFLMNIVHFSVALLNNDCDQSKIFLFFCAIQNLFMTLMFIDFYIKSYIRKPKLKKAVQK